MSLTGKVAVVTGAAQGIGEAYAERLASLGAVTVILDIDGEGARKTAERLCDKGFQAEGRRADISDADGMAAIAAEVADAHGGIDILVNNAGLYRGLEKAIIDDLDPELWRRHVDVNLSGTFYAIRAVVPHMRPRGWGRIVNQGSIAAYLAREGSLHYAVTKAAVMSMVKVLARELGSAGITVNAIAPGPVSSAATMERMSPEHAAGYAAQTAIGRMATPEDMADVLEFLCSPKSGVITGQTLVADGGICFLG